MTRVAASGAQRLSSLERARLHRRPGCAAQHEDREESIQGGAPTCRWRVRVGSGAERAPRQRNLTLLVTVRAEAHAAAAVSEAREREPTARADRT